MKALVEYKNVSKRFGKKKVLKNISFNIGRGRIVGLIGKNGVGKSTILKLMNDLLTVDSGEILIDGKKVGIETKKIVAFLPERSCLDKSMKVKETIKFFADFFEDFDEKKAHKLISEFQIDENEQLSHLSKGMQEKVQLTLVMSRKAKLYVLDEPLGGIDPATREYILDTILKNINKGASMLISTHLISDIERILDDVIIIDDGMVYMQGKAKALKKKYKKSIDGIFRMEFKNAR